MREGKFEEGQNIFKESAKLKESLIPMLERLTELYMKHNKYVEALSYLSRLLDLKEKLRDPEHFSLVETLCKISNLYKLQQRYDVADATYQKALKIAEKSLQSNENMIRMHVSQSKLEDANKAIMRNLEIKKVLIVTLTSMIDLYQVMNKIDDISNLKKRLAEAGNATTSMQNLGVPNVSPIVKKT